MLLEGARSCGRPLHYKVYELPRSPETANAFPGDDEEENGSCHVADQPAEEYREYSQ